MTTTTQEQLEGLGTYRFGWADPDVAGASARRGLSDEVVRDISTRKNEPEWMLDMRLKGLRLFQRKPMPQWGADLSGINFDSIKYFVRSTEKQATSWEELPADIKATYDKLAKMSGADFDKAYIDAMVKDHDEDVKEFKKATATSSDAELKAWAQKTLSVIEQHDHMAHQDKDAIKK